MENLALCSFLSQKRMATATIHRADSEALAAMIDVGDGVEMAIANPCIAKRLRIGFLKDLVSAWWLEIDLSS